MNAKCTTFTPTFVYGNLVNYWTVFVYICILEDEDTKSIKKPEKHRSNEDTCLREIGLRLHDSVNYSTLNNERKLRESCIYSLKESTTYTSDNE